MNFFFLNIVFIIYTKIRIQKVSCEIFYFRISLIDIEGMIVIIWENFIYNDGENEKSRWCFFSFKTLYQAHAIQILQPGSDSVLTLSYHHT